MQIITQNRCKPKVSILARQLPKRLPPVHPALAGFKQRIDAGMEQSIPKQDEPEPKELKSLRQQFFDGGYDVTAITLRKIIREKLRR